MPLSRLTYVAYRTRNFTGAQSEYNAHKVIQAVKGREVKGYAWVPLGNGKKFKLEQSNSAAVFPWFGSLASSEVTRRFPAQQLCLVPIPNSDCVVGVKAAKAVKIAQQIARKNDDLFSVWDGLRWVAPNTPSSHGGTREPKGLFENLVCVDVAPDCACILVDDVTTSGGHFQAADALLRREGGSVLLALAIGQSVHDPVEEPFGWIETALDSYEPA